MGLIPTRSNIPLRVCYSQITSKLCWVAIISDIPYLILTFYIQPLDARSDLLPIQIEQDATEHTLRRRGRERLVRNEIW